LFDKNLLKITTNMRRAIIIVIDGFGVGALPDAEEYGDAMTCNTLANLARSIGGLDLPNLQQLGLGNVIPVEGLAPATSPTASYGRMKESATGKDSTTGHWELAGFVLEQPFRVFPNGFPPELMDRFVAAIGTDGYLGNCPASGTDIIDQFHEEHTKTGKPIIYTSADSVFQIACNVEVVPLETLYHWCEIAREMVSGPYNVSRVIARPYKVTEAGLSRLHSKRHDYGIKPSQPTLLNRVVEQGGRVIGIGKIADLFVESGITHAVHTDNNQEGIDATVAAINGDLELGKIELNGSNGNGSANQNPTMELIFTNLVDTDTEFGHRRDPAGYSRALKQIDQQLPRILSGLGNDDLLIITSDHGNDPTASGSDHTREYVPLLITGPTNQPEDLGTLESYSYVSKVVSQWLELG
jgi:phosphopentomutase